MNFDEHVDFHSEFDVLLVNFKEHTNMNETCDWRDLVTSILMMQLFFTRTILRYRRDTRAVSNVIVQDE